MKNINELLGFIENSPSPFHAVETISDRLDNAGFTRLYEQDDWQLEKGKGYYVCRNYSSVVCYVLIFIHWYIKVTSYKYFFP